MYLGKEKVAPVIKEKVPSMKAFFEAGGKCAYSIATTFEGCWNYEDSSNMTSMNKMFYYCQRLATVPALDTSNVTSMSGMFDSCPELTTIPALDTSNVTSMSGMFYSCSKLTAIPALDTSNVTSMNRMFYACSKLTAIPALDTSNVTSMNDMFYACSSLTEIHMTNIGENLGISASTKFTREALLEIIGNLRAVTSAKTLTMGATNLAKLTDEDKKIATDKGWTLE